MWTDFKRLFLGLGLIALAAAALLISDRANRTGPGQRMPRVALLQFASNPPMEDLARGGVEELARRGFVDGRTMRLTRFNAENDMPTANSMSKAVVDGGFDVVMTFSTPCLQTMASVNRQGKVKHVFGGVTDPAGSGVGISRTDPLDHPRYMAGVGTFQPVREVFHLAREMRPTLKTVGLVWNPGEACSLACVVRARETAKQLGIQLVEATVDNSAGVYESAASVASRGAEAVFVGCDNTVEMAMVSVVKAAAQMRIPVLGYAPKHVDVGAILGMGADYSEVGRVVGALTAEVLNGRDPATVRIENVMPRMVTLNLAANARLREPWNIPKEAIESAGKVIDEQGRVTDRTKAAGGAPAAAASAPARKWRIEMIDLVEAPPIEDSRKGVLAGLRESGLVEGRDYEVRSRSAQGDMANLNTMVDAAVTAKADMIYTITTPALQTAMNKVHDRPIMYALSLDPLLVGDRGTHEKHRTNVAGVFDRSPFEGMVKLLRECLPRARRIGTLFAPGEPNSVHFRGELERVGRAAGFEVVAIPSTNAAEVNDGAMALVGRGIDAVCQINDNLHEAAFPSIATAARRARLPVFGFSTGQIGRGASVILSNDHFDGGRESGRLAARVIRGESPAAIPYRGIQRQRLMVDPEAASAVGFTIPASVLARAEKKK